MFIGIYYHTLEAKGRLAIPASFRRNLDKGSVVTRGLDGCLFLFPARDWRKFVKKLQQSPLTQKKAREFVRLMTHQAAEVEFDSQGRTRIPSYLQELAGLKKEVVIAGSLDRIEIWDKARYHRYMRKIEERSEEIAESLTELGI
ncbi:division/cell wall cluster transcriptional repressor MraZ [Patescibacteria group bacterium]|nr:division/cell wall cluster transcriptional repressor MraZ [Patescibacteria group bacterium]